MSIPVYQTVSVNCPNCRHAFTTPVLSIVDVSQNPEAKALLLSGRINVAVCPQCGSAGALSAPLVYHDPEKELFFTFVPSELGLPDAEQQRLVGDLTNRVISALPAEQRKGYLLRPQSFFRLEGMIEAILEADGITPEMLEAQRARADLLQRLLQATSEDARRVIAQENDAQIDYEFFQFLTLNLELSQAEGREANVQELNALRKQLLEWTSVGRDAAAREEAIRSLGTEVTRERLLEKLVEAALAGEEAKVETMVAVARPAIDYIFYQQLTDRIEAAQKAGSVDQAETLKALRETVLDLTAEIDAEVQKAMEQAGQLVEEIVASDNLEDAIRDNLAQIDDLFLNVLAANIQAAEQSGRTEDAGRLRQIGDTVMQVIEQSQPPEVQLLNKLVAAEYPEGTQALLEENRALVDSTLLEVMDLVGEDLRQNNRQETAERLAQIREQASSMIG